SLPNLILALAVAYVPRVARLVRSSVLVVRELEHVQAARAVGVPEMPLLLRHILPLCWSPIIVQMTLVFAMTVLAEASLTFLGVARSDRVARRGPGGGRGAGPAGALPGTPQAADDQVQQVASRFGQGAVPPPADVDRTLVRQLANLQARQEAGPHRFLDGEAG